MLKRVAPAIAGLVVVAALAVAVPTATGHPEECAGTAAWATTDGGYSPYLSWQGAEESICASRSVTSRYDDSDAKLTREGQSATAGLRLIASRAKHGPFNTESAFNSDLAFENGYAYQGNYEGVTIYDVRDPSNPTVAGQILCPGSQNDVTVNDGILVTSTDSRRTNDGCNSTATTTADRADHVGGPEGLRRARPDGAQAAHQRADRLRLAHPHRAARRPTACSSTSSPTT